MGQKRTEEFKADAVRLALSSGRPRRQLANDLGVGFSTLNKWVTTHLEADLMSGPHEDLAK
jgi:transposase